MTDVNVNAPTGQAPTMAPPICTDDQISPHIRWVLIGKSNCYLDVEKSKSNLIYKIAVDILKHTNFFRAFTASSTIPSIYIQQFWNTVRYDKSAGCYRCQLDEQWFDLTKDTLRDALQITLVNNNQAFTSPPSSDVLINFVNELGYPKLVRNLSNVVTNDMFQPCRALTTIINMCLTGKTSGFERPRAPVLQILWGVVTRAHIDHAERIWEEFTQSIHTFIEDKRNLAQHIHRKKKATLIVIPKHVLGYLKFSAKGTKREVSGMPIPGSLSTADIQEASYYQEYLAKVAKHKRYLAAKTQGKKRKLTTEISDKPSKAMKSRPGLVSKKLKPLSSLRSVDESVAEDVPAKEPRVNDDKDDVQRALEESLKSMYDVPRGSLPPVVIREHERTSKPTGSSGHDESSSLYVELGLTDSEDESEEDVPGAEAGDHEHMDLDVADVSTQPPPEQMDESDKPLESDNDKATAETEAESIVYVTIQQDMSSIPPMTTLIIDLTSRPESPKNKRLEKRLDNHGARLYTLEQLDIPHQVRKSIDEVVTDAVDWAMQVPLRNCFRDLPKADMKEIIHQRIWETDSYKSHENHMQLYEALEKSMNHDHSEELAKDLAEARKKKKKSRESPKTPPGSPPYQPPPPPPAGPSGASRSPEAFGSSQVPPPPPLPPSTNQEGQSKGFAALSSSKTAASAEYQAWTTPDIRLRPSISLTLTDLQMDEDMAPDEQAQSSDDEDIGNAHIPKTGDIAMFMDWFCKRRGITKLKPQDLDGPAFEIIKVFHPDMWIEEECKYDIAAMYGISHWWFQRQRFYIDRHTSAGDRRAVRTHMRILSVVRIEVFSMYGYDYIKKIVLRHADLNEHVIAERDFKYLYPSDFKDMYPLNLQGHLNHLSPKYKKILTTAQIDEALDYRVKEFRINKMNPGLNTRFWTRKDVDRSKEFMFAIQKRLKTRRIFRNLESFVGGRVRDGDYRLLKHTE
nr:monodehydroascorbate reductase [Tanacetum cinerariifolium]